MYTVTVTVPLSHMKPSSTSLTVVTVRSIAYYSEVEEGQRCFVH